MQLKHRVPLFFSLLFSLLLASVMMTVYYLFANFRKVEFKDRLAEKAGAPQCRGVGYRVHLRGPVRTVRSANPRLRDASNPDVRQVEPGVEPWVINSLRVVPAVAGSGGTAPWRRLPASLMSVLVENASLCSKDGRAEDPWSPNSFGTPGRALRDTSQYSRLYRLLGQQIQMPRRDLAGEEGKGAYAVSRW